MAVNDVWKATASFTGPQGQTYQWVWHYIQTAGGAVLTTALIDAIEAMLVDAWGEIEDFVSTLVVGDTLDLAKYDPGSGEFDTVRTNDISALAGAGAADSAPSNVAPFVTFFTAVGRSRGKKFLFGILESALTNGQISVGLLAAMALFGAFFNNDVAQGANDFSPGNFNLAEELFRTWLSTELGVGIFSGSQYRRLPGRGV
jgi:hypothetical protein